MQNLIVSLQKLIIHSLIYNTEDLHIVMPMYNLIGYSKNYRKATGSLWNYYRDEPNSVSDGVINNKINYSIKDSKSFNYKPSTTGKLEVGNVQKDDVEIVVPLKHLSNFWRMLDMPLINSEVYLTLTWCENYVLTSTAYKEKVAAQGKNPCVDGIDSPTGARFKKGTQNCMFQ